MSIFFTNVTLKDIWANWNQLNKPTQFKTIQLTNLLLCFRTSEVRASGLLRAPSPPHTFAPQTPPPQPLPFQQPHQPFSVKKACRLHCDMCTRVLVCQITITRIKYEKIYKEQIGVFKKKFLWMEIRERKNVLSPITILCHVGCFSF